MNAKVETFQVAGRKATHTITVQQWTVASSIEWEAQWHADGCPKSGQSWKPENGAEFKTKGQAIGWLKKLLKKEGWPEPTVWTIEIVFVRDRNYYAISVCCE